MPKLTINGTEIEVAPGTSVLQACEELGIEIPRFCYHDRLSVPANCRMCLVEMKGAPKPIPSCGMAAADGMEIETDSELTHKARKGVVEMLLINHPLDCPICDQGGECDLQDETMAYGFDRGRYGEPKRAVADKDIGPLIRTHMTRCIHCTRCVRFSEEVAGHPEMGMTYRGEDAEIGPWIDAPITSELSGNMIDICPVGALTSKPFAFRARSWELHRTETVDVMDGVGSNIVVQARGGEVMRVLPALSEAVNEEWIADKTRFAYDGLRARRLDRPWIREGAGLRPASWDEALDRVAARLAESEGARIAAIAGDQVEAESLKALGDLLGQRGPVRRECRQHGENFDASERCGYLFNPTIAGIETADLILLAGAFPRWEASMVNARIRKRYMMGGVRIAALGEARDHGYPAEDLGIDPGTLEEIATGRHALCEALTRAERPMMIAGPGLFQRPDGMALHHLCWRIGDKYLLREGWTGFAMLHGAASRVAALDLGWTPGPGGSELPGILADARAGKLDLVWLHGADEIDMAALDDVFVVYQGHHGDRGAAAADVILPGAAYTEKSGLYANLEGRVQRGRRAVAPPGEAREDWKIPRALSERLAARGAGRRLPYDTLGQLRQALIAVFEPMGEIDAITPAGWAPFGEAGEIDRAAPLTSPVENYYRTCAISRASRVMGKCTAELLPTSPGARRPGRAEESRRTGTDG